MVGAARLELATPRSQSECATNCATPRLFYLVYISIYLFCKLFWGEWWDLNPRPSEPQSDALPTELHPPLIEGRY
jgi:hypothetical protein